MFVCRGSLSADIWGALNIFLQIWTPEENTETLNERNSQVCVSVCVLHEIQKGWCHWRNSSNIKVEQHKHVLFENGKKIL